MKDESNNKFSNSFLDLNIKRGSILFLISFILTLFFIEAMRAYIPGIYIQMFHVVFTDEGWEFSLLSLMTMGLFAIPLFSKILSDKFGKKQIMYISIIIISICRLLISFGVAAIIHTTLSGIIIGFYGIFMACFLGILLENQSKESKVVKVGFYSFSFFLAILIDFTIRTVGFTADYTLINWAMEPWYNYQYLWTVFQIILSAVSIILPVIIWKDISVSEGSEEAAKNEKTGKNFIALIVGLGLGTFLFLGFNILLYPNAIAQFTETNYFIVNLIIIVVITLTCYIFLEIKEKRIGVEILMILNVFLIISLVIFLFLGHLSGYVAMILISISFAPILMDIYILFKLAGMKGKRNNKVRMYSNAFSIALGIFLLFSFLYDFTTDWSFIIRAFRGLGIPILLVGSVLLLVSVLITIFMLKNKEVQK
ncbi:MAG: hypothetical protein EU548_02165 [Promethearchaeota archaeon]|nr:MAG: hypothetical protein EU548_02165 [Candidatus Lokiarchaeota archaeon]